MPEIRDRELLLETLFGDLTYFTREDAHYARVIDEEVEVDEIERKLFVAIPTAAKDVVSSSTRPDSMCGPPGPLRGCGPPGNPLRQERIRFRGRSRDV